MIDRTVKYEIYELSLITTMQATEDLNLHPLMMQKLKTFQTHQFQLETSDSYQ